MNMKKQKETVGISIEYFLHENQLVSWFRIAMGVPSKTFFTSRAIQKTIVDSHARIGQSLGNMNIDYVPKTKTGDWISYMPRGFSFLNDPRFTKIGIAQELELRVIKKFKETFPATKGFFHVNPSPARRTQLARRGLGTKYSYEQATAALRQKIRTDRKKHQRKRLP